MKRRRLEELSTVEVVEVEGRRMVRWKRRIVPGKMEGRVWRIVGKDERRTWVEDGSVDVATGILLLPLGSSVLKPDLDLSLCQVECQRQVETLADGEVPCLSELVLQRHELFIGESSSHASWFPSSIHSSSVFPHVRPIIVAIQVFVVVFIVTFY